ncbi:MAG: tetratricopeptide repeat protein [Chloroflexota bacterium]
MLKLLLLGKPSVFLNNVPVTDFVSSKVQGVLFYLAVTQQTHSRQALIGLFWGQDSEAKAKSSLRVALSNLKRLLPDYLEATRTSVGLAQDRPFSLDLHQFQNLIRTETLTDQEQATALYRGEFLADFQVDGTPAFEAWLLAQRTHWQQLALQLFAKLAQGQMGVRDYETAVSTLQRLLKIEPWQEAAHRDLMVAYSRQRDFNAALNQYESCRQLLRAELDVAPMAETAALQERILEARQQPPPALPHDATTFFGRESDVNIIRQRLVDPTCRLVTVVGLGGMGKTRLALAAAHAIAHEEGLFFLNGVAFVPLQTLEPQTAHEAEDGIALAIAQVLGVYLPGRKRPSVELAAYLQGQEMLLVLDNFEQLLDAAPWLTQLLSQCPDLKLLVTSREPLNITAEWRHDLAGLPTQSDPSQAMSQPTSPAVALFTQTAQQVQVAFAETAVTRPHIHQLCQLVDGAPLAIKLAASWLRVMPIDKLVVEAQSSLDIFSTRMRDVPARQRSMRSILLATWQTLSDREQQTLAALSVFRDGFAEKAARKITQASPLILAELKDRSLIQFDPDLRRYSLHALVQQFAGEVLVAEEETAVSLRTAHMDYYTAILAALTPQLSGVAPQRAYAAIQQEIGNVQMAWQEAVAQLNLGCLTQLAEPLVHFYTRQGWFREGQERVAVAIQALQASGRQERTAVRLMSNLLTRQGMLTGRIGQFAEAEAALKQSLEKARQAADPYLLSFALLELGRLLRDQSRFAEATKLYEESYEIATELNDRVLIGRATEQLGVVAWDHGGHGEAEKKLTEALSIFRSLNHTRQIAQTLNSLGNVLMSMGHNEAAVDRFQEALTIAYSLEEGLFLDTILINLGMVSNQLANYEEAQRYYEESLAICRRIGDEIGVAYCLTGLGQVYLEAGELADAERLIEQSLAINRRMGRDRYVGINLNYLGDVAKAAQNWAAARAYYEESLAASERIGHPWGVASSQERFGDLELVLGHEDVAAQHFLAALKLGQEMEAPAFVLTALTNLAALLMNRGERETAVRVLQIILADSARQPALRERAEGLLAGETVVVEVERLGLETAVLLVQSHFEQ